MEVCLLFLNLLSLMDPLLSRRESGERNTWSHGEAIKTTHNELEHSPFTQSKPPPEIDRIRCFLPKHARMELRGGGAAE